MNDNEFRYLLNLSCPDRIGIVRAVAQFLVDARCNILDSAQYGDPDSGRFFMRVHVEALDGSRDELAEGFASVADSFAMSWQLFDEAIRPRVLILVSKEDHCLHELLYRWRNHSLRMHVVGVVSNHQACRALVEGHGLAFHHLPVEPASRPDQERRIAALADELDAELVVLARYMQILSDDLCSRLEGRCINIHHSFLPSFKGARPYHQAHEHGVKLIGATAHYVTADLDEGPIIEQDVARVDHTLPVSALIERGRDIERLVLARAVRLHVERRVLINGRRTVVFA